MQNSRSNGFRDRRNRARESENGPRRACGQDVWGTVDGETDVCELSGERSEARSPRSEEVQQMVQEEGNHHMESMRKCLPSE